MTTITAVEDLLRVPEGATINVTTPNHRSAWTRIGTLLRRSDGISIPTILFEGAVAAEHVVIPDEVTLIPREGEGGESTESSESTVTPGALVTAREEGRLAGIAEFREHMVQEWDGASFNAGEVNDLFDHFGLDPLPPARVNVDVAVSVTGTYELSYVEAERLINDGRSADVAEDVSIQWTWETTAQAEVDEGDCACGEVDSEVVEDLLREANIGYESFDFSLSCQNCAF